MGATTTQPAWSQQPWPYPKSWEEWERKILRAAPSEDAAGRRYRIEFKRRLPKRVRFPVRGDAPSEWRKADGYKTVADGTSRKHDFRLWKREYPSVTWETWYITTVQVEFWVKSDRNVWDWLRGLLRRGDVDVLVDAHEYTFGDRVSGSQPETLQSVTEWRWVRSSLHDKTPEWTAGIQVSAAGLAGGAIEETTGGLETETQLNIPPERRPCASPWREGLEYRPEDELRPGSPERMPSNTEHFDLHIVALSGGAAEPEVEVFAGDVPLGKVRLNRPLRVPLRILPDPDAPAWPPWGTNRDVPVSSPGFVVRDGPPTSSTDSPPQVAPEPSPAPGEPPRSEPVQEPPGAEARPTSAGTGEASGHEGGPPAAPGLAAPQEEGEATASGQPDPVQGSDQVAPSTEETAAGSGGDPAPVQQTPAEARVAADTAQPPKPARQPRSRH